VNDPKEILTSVYHADFCGGDCGGKLCGRLTRGEYVELSCDACGEIIAHLHSGDAEEILAELERRYTRFLV
jgi:hypothetical protein